MSATFVDSYLPERILGYNFTSSPRFSTSITAVASGSERRNRNWLHPLHKFNAPEGVRCNEDVFDLLRMWYAFGGPECSFAFRDPMDFASVQLDFPGTPPDITATDQIIGTGDSMTTEFQLIKNYTYGTRSYNREVYLPITDSVLVNLNGHELDDGILPGGPYTWDVDRNSGVVTISPAPSFGLVVTAGFLFDVEARFESDTSLDSVIKAFKQSGYAELNFVEVRPC